MLLDGETTLSELGAFFAHVALYASHTAVLHTNIYLRVQYQALYFFDCRSSKIKTLTAVHTDGHTMALLSGRAHAFLACILASASTPAVGTAVAGAAGLPCEYWLCEESATGPYSKLNVSALGIKVYVKAAARQRVHPLPTILLLRLSNRRC